MKRICAALFLALIVCFVASASETACGVDFSLDPTATYLRVNESVSVPGALAVDLTSLGIDPGDILSITRLGDYKRGPDYTDTFLDLIGVFSSSSALGPQTDLNRVPGAIDAGVDFVSDPTHDGGFPTDIPEDFEISSIGGPVSSVIIEVPTGAAHLFISTRDIYFNDNTDPDSDFGVRLLVVPEPASATLFATGATLITILALRRRN